MEEMAHFALHLVSGHRATTPEAQPGVQLPDVYMLLSVQCFHVIVTPVVAKEKARRELPHSRQKRRSEQADTKTVFTC